MRRSIRLALTSGAVDQHEHGSQPRDRRRFGDGTLWSFGGVEVVSIVQEPDPAIPLFRHHSAEYGGRIAVIFLQHGDVTVSHEGGQYRFSAGSAAYIATGTNTTVETMDHCRVTMVSIPRSWLSEAGVEMTSTFGAFAYSIGKNSALLAFLTALVDVVEKHSVPAEPTSTVLTNLVADLFLEDRAYSIGSDSSQINLRALADSLIALNSGDTNFHASGLADHLRMSLSELDRTFNETGTHGSTADAIRERRILVAMLGLQTSDQNALTVQEVARKAGFTTTKELQRALKHVYGTNVKEVLLAQSGAVRPG